MKIPEPYFKNVPFIGDLKLDYIFFEDIYPVFFTCLDKLKNLYICSCCDYINEQRWIVSPVNNEDILNMLKNKISLYKIFEIGEGYRFIIIWHKNKEICNMVNFEDINKADLPNDASYFDADEDEYNEYVKHIDNKTDKDLYNDFLCATNNFCDIQYSNKNMNQCTISYHLYSRDMKAILSYNASSIDENETFLNKRFYHYSAYYMNMKMYDYIKLQYINNVSDNVSLKGKSKIVNSVVRKQICLCVN